MPPKRIVAGEPRLRVFIKSLSSQVLQLARPPELNRSIASEQTHVVNASRILRMILAIALASIICFVASCLVAKILLILNHGFGAGDMTAFLYWTSYFAGLLILPSLGFAIVFRNVRIINRVWVGVLLGGFAGFGWTLLNLWFLGPWFGAWSFNVLYCWVLGGAFGILALALLGHRPRALP